MTSFGNTVYFGGTTKSTNDPDLVDALFFAVQDNGEPGKGVDKISRVFFWDDDPTTSGDPQACQSNQVTDFPLELIESKTSRSSRSRTDRAEGCPQRFVATLGPGCVTPAALRRSRLLFWPCEYPELGRAAGGLGA